MIQLLLHLFGDYFTQNDWMAINKAKFSIEGWLACLIHCILYSIPFGWYYYSWLIFAVCFLSHFAIDKFGLAKYVIMLKNWYWDGSNFGFYKERPVFLTLWLYIITDNSLHLFSNYFMIKYLA